MQEKIERYILTKHKIYDIKNHNVIQTPFDFLTSFKRPYICSAGTIDELVEYCINEKIPIYALLTNDQVVLLNHEPFYEVQLERAKKLFMWQGKDLVCAYEFKEEIK